MWIQCYKFRQDLNQFHFRCGCPFKCRRRMITLTVLSQNFKNHTTRHTSFTKYAKFNFQPYFKEFSFHILYSGSSLVADIGGYLGLFLGLSVFGMVQLLEKTVLSGKSVRRSMTIKSLENFKLKNIE